MAESNSPISKLNARAGAPTSGLIHTMSTTTTAVAPVRTSTIARAVTSSTKAVPTSTPVSSSLVIAPKVTTSSQVRAVTTSTPVKVTSTTAAPVVKTTSTTPSSSKVVPTTSSTPSSSTIPTPTSTSSRISTSTSTSTTSSKSTQSPSSSSTLSSSSTINIVAPASASASGKESSSSGISGGAIAGIVIGILIVGIAGALLAFRLIQRRRRANRRLTGNLQAWTDRTSYFSASGSGTGAGARGEREVEAGQVPFREMGDKDQDGGLWTLGEKQTYEEPMLAGVGAGSAAYAQQHSQHAYQPEYQQQMQQHAYQPYADHQSYMQPPQTPTHQTHPQGYPYTPTPGTATPNTFGETFSPVNPTGPVPPQEVAAGPVLQDGMPVVVRQGFVRTLEDELVIAPGDYLTVVQAYDDGWCLCQSALNEQGVVPQSCLEPVSAYAQGRTSPIQMPTPAVVVVSDGNDEVLAAEPEKNLPSLPRSETTKSLAVSERSERRSSLFLNAAAAGLYLQQNVTPTNQAFT